MIPGQIVKECADPFHDTVDEKTKGALGEALVKSYFEYAGWAVESTGIESVVDHLMQAARFSTGDLAALPDFLVSKTAGSPMNPNVTRSLGQAFYVEVKTWRQWGAYEGAPVDLNKYARFGTVLIVWVGPEEIRGLWLTAPAPGARAARNPGSVYAAEFVALATVGEVQIQHCQNDACERNLRKRFRTLAQLIAAM